MQELEQALIRDDAYSLKHIFEHNYNKIRPVINNLFWRAVAKKKLSFAAHLLSCDGCTPFKEGNISNKWDELKNTNQNFLDELINCQLYPSLMSLECAISILSILFLKSDTGISLSTVKAMKQLTEKYMYDESNINIEYLLGRCLEKEDFSSAEVLIEWGVSFSPASVRQWAVSGLSFNNNAILNVRHRQWPSLETSIYAEELLTIIRNDSENIVPILIANNRYSALMSMLFILNDKKIEHDSLLYAGKYCIKHPADSFSKSFYERNKGDVVACFKPSNVWAMAQINKLLGKKTSIVEYELCERYSNDIDRFCNEHVVKSSKVKIKSVNDIKSLIDSAKKTDKPIHLLFLKNIIKYHGLDAIAPFITRQDQVDFLTKIGYDPLSLMINVKQASLKVYLMKKLSQ